jgi:hypothetical protein
MNVSNEDEEEAYATKLRVEGVVEKSVYEEFKKVYMLECEAAAKDDRCKPSRSEVLEMLLRKGLKAYFKKE